MKTDAIIFTGIDVSKDELVIACGVKGQTKKIKIPNTLEAINAWLLDTGTENTHFVLEYTGNYSQRLIHVLHKQSALFSVVNPSQSRAMSKVLAKTHKNDDQDAQTLCVMGQKMELEAYKMPDAEQKRRKEAFSVLSSLQKMERQLKNQIHAFEYLVDPNPTALNALKEMLKATEANLATLEQEISIEKNEKTDGAQVTENKTDKEGELKEIAKLIRSIKSIGKITADACITLFDDFKYFDDAKAFVKFIGLSPSEYSSGSTVRGRNSITKRGNSKIRSLLFNCARNAIQHNKSCKELYDRLLKKGKNGKSALIAVMHKLARLIYGVVHSKQPYDEKFVEKKQIVTA